MAHYRATEGIVMLIGVFRSPDRAPCEDRAFMLAAVNIPSSIEAGPLGFELQVHQAQAAFATHHLWQYEQEHAVRPALPPPAATVHPRAWIGSLAYMAVMILVALAVVRGWGPADMFARGALTAQAIQGAEWWRTITALTLHFDIVHLMMNLGSGVAIGWLASRQLGNGHAWLLTLIAASFSNLLEAALASPAHLSVGASTAVFAALGLLTAFMWRMRRHGAPGWARRVAPLVAGIALLGLLGAGAGVIEETEGPTTNLVAHAFGFIMGAACGVIAAIPRVAALLRRTPQWCSGVIALALVSAAWGFALIG